MINKIYILIFLFSLHGYAQTVKYTPVWFGPNALPVPEFTDGRIPSKTTINLSGDYYYGYGDETKNAFVRLEIPLLPERISYKIWGPFLEFYKVTPDVNVARGMVVGKTTGFSGGGDFYVQTRIALLKETKAQPDIIFNSTLKTASAKEHSFKERRAYDTPGYYFDLEMGKSVLVENYLFREIRGVVDLGFLCWETTASRQNDAPLYGGKIILGNRGWQLENTLSGYWGWIHTHYDSNYGDTPLVYAVKLTILSSSLNFYSQYQCGINDYPYKQIRAGLILTIKALTPTF